MEVVAALLKLRELAQRDYNFGPYEVVVGPNLYGMLREEYATHVYRLTVEDRILQIAGVVRLVRDDKFYSDSPALRVI